MNSMQGASSALTQRLSVFRDQFKKVLGPKRQGYGELGLDEPLVGSDGDPVQQQQDQYSRRHGVAPPGSTGTGHHAGHSDAYPAVVGSAGDVPTQGEELRQLAALSREAAEILWEMAAMQDAGDAAQEMLEKSTTLQAQLRGMIGDYRDTDEEALASALEVYDQLTNTLSEYSGKKPAQAPPSYGQQQQSYPSSAQQGSAYGKSGLGSLGPAPGTSAGIAPGQKPKGEEAPLISFD